MINRDLTMVNVDDDDHDDDDDDDDTSWGMIIFTMNNKDCHGGYG